MRTIDRHRIFSTDQRRELEFKLPSARARHAKLSRGRIGRLPGKHSQGLFEVWQHDSPYHRGHEPQRREPEASCNIFNFVAIGKQTLGFKLTDAEISFLTADAFIRNVNGGGLEAFIESPEADSWPALRCLLQVGPPENLEHLTD